MRVLNPRTVLAAVLSTIVLAACGIAEDDNGPAADQASVDAGVAAAQKALDEAKAVPAWTAPGPAIDPAKLEGKKVFVLPINSSDYETQLQAAEKAAADKAGVELTFYQNQGAVADWIKGLTTAVSQKPDLIFLESSPDPKQLAPQLEAAQEAGIPVVASHTWDTEAPDAPDCDGCENLTAVVKAPFSEGGKLGADWVTVDSKGSANVLIVTIDGIQAAATMTEAAQAEYEEVCPNCQVKVVSLALTDISNGAIAAVTSALTQDPDIDYVNAQFDLLLPGVQASMKVGNHDSGIKVFSFNGTSAGLAQVADPDSPVAMNVAEPLRWTAYANMDQIFRGLADMPPVSDSNPIRIFDKSNIDEAGSAPEYDDGFGTDYIEQFEKLWGVG